MVALPSRHRPLLALGIAQLVGAGGRLGTPVALYRAAKAKLRSEPRKAGSRPMRITIAPEITPGTYRDSNEPKLSAAPAMGGLLGSLATPHPRFGIAPAALLSPPLDLILTRKP